VFCNQHSISGCQRQPEPDEVREIILEHLKTIPEKDTHIEIGFFGGSFTGIETELQEKYLAVANEFLYRRCLGEAETIGTEVEKIGDSAETTRIRNRIHGIRLSTRPDYIDEEVLKRLKYYGVTTIELGAQSLDEEVLRLSGRGHTVAEVEKASALILSSGFELGLQMMTGLPGDTSEKSMHTAKRIVELGAYCTRIYPTLVIRGTELAERWKKGEYQPQSLEEAVEVSAVLLEIFRDGGVEVIRVGLHPSEGILDGSELMAGPFHPAFRELVESLLWKMKLSPLMSQHPKGSNIQIPVPDNELRYAIGHDSSNRKMLESHFNVAEFVVDKTHERELPLIITDKRLPLPAKNTLKTIGHPVYLHTEGLVYKSISGHPDIFMCQGGDGIVLAPGIPVEIRKMLSTKGIRLFEGEVNPGKTYPESARFNVVVTAEYIIHNLKNTDPAILEAFPGRKHLHVNQGYTRCNLLALGRNHFITSDKGIENVISAEGKKVLFVDPKPVRLKGQKHGFFPGCCGVYNDELLISGSLSFHPEKDRIAGFIHEGGFIIRELFQGELTDVGGIFTC
jgi:hypothetical protein